MKNTSKLRPKIISIGISLCAAAVLQGCSDSGDSAPPVDLFTLLAQGGNGGENGGSGGSGGRVDALIDGVGNIEYTNSGEVAVTAGLKNIATLKKELGSNPLMVTADMTIVSIPAGMPRPTTVGVPYFVENFPGFVYLSSGTGNIPLTGETEDKVTGINVAEGVTLTLALNAFGSEGRLLVANDVCNFGEITSEDVSATQRGGISLDGGRYIGTGTVSTYGMLDRQAGGDINITGEYSAYNSGNLSAYGANTTTTAANAGGGGSITINGGFYSENSGDLSSYGGDATDGSGGDGGSVRLYGDGDTANTGSFDSHGGLGTTNGGFGGSLRVDSNEFGDAKNTGDMMSYGGIASVGDGGDGGDYDIAAEVGDIWHNATVMSYGGNSTDAAGSGGDGGNVDFRTDENDFNSDARDDRTSGNIYVSGDIDARGGSALLTGTGNGGQGGNVTFDVDSHDQPKFEREVIARGYASFNTSGGDANYGGDAGYVEATIDNEDGDDDVEYSNGNVTNRVAVMARGGNVVASAVLGNSFVGSGGRFRLETPFYQGFNDKAKSEALNTGDLDLSTGTGAVDSTFARNGGEVDMWGYTKVQNTGDIISVGEADGGTNEGIDGFGNNGGRIKMLTESGTASNSGTLSISGGYGEFIGGRAGDVDIVGFTGASSNKDITANGGDADPAVFGSFGGDGSYIGLFTGASGKATISGTLSYNGGAGETNGEGGAVATNDTCKGDGC